MRTLHYALIAVAASVIAAACSATVRNGGFGGEGGSTDQSGAGGGGGATSATGAGGGIQDAGVPDAKVGCTGASDCAALNGNCKVGQCINGVCVQAPANEFGTCDDGLYCTDDDICVNGACVGTPKFCASLDSCHLGVCDEDLKTCKNIPGNEGQQCDDQNPCTYMGTCNSGVCIQGQQIDCTVFDATCTKGVCDPVVGCKAIPSNDGVACDDQLYCTINDKCTNGKCVGAPNTCAAPGDVCMIGSCDEGTDKCVAVAGNDGGGCDDKNLCTTGETCLAGKCQGGQPANDGMACDDQNGCTGGTTCTGGACGNPQSQVVACINNDMCCPAGCANDTDCLFWQSGILQNIPASSLTGWTKCWNGTYDQNQPSMAQILNQCNKSKLLMACHPVGTQTYNLLAMAPRVDVLFDCGQQSNCTKVSNDVGWYYSDSWSWGFAKAGEPVTRNSCDVGNTFPDLRMCWHSGGGSINSGYRCGNTFLNGDPSWERVVYHAD